jgi:hypothetical protein
MMGDARAPNARRRSRSAAPHGASGVLHGDFAVMVDLRNPVRSRANGKLEGADA